MDFKLIEKTNGSCYSCYMVSLYNRSMRQKEIVWSNIFCPERFIPKNRDFKYEVLPLEGFEEKVNEKIKRAAKEYVTKTNRGGVRCVPSFGLYGFIVESEYVPRW